MADEILLEDNDISSAVNRANNTCVSKYIGKAEFDACVTGVRAVVDELLIKKAEEKWWKMITIAVVQATLK